MKIFFCNDEKQKEIKNAAVKIFKHDRQFTSINGEKDYKGDKTEQAPSG